MAEAATSDATQNTAPSTTTQSNTPATQAANTEKTETYTKEEMTKIVSLRLKEQKAQFEKQLEDANKSELELKNARIAELEAKEAQRATKDEVVTYLKRNGCDRSESAYLLVKDNIRRDKDGKVEDLKGLLAEAKEIKKEFDYNNFLLEELLKAKLQAEEQGDLEKELTILENAEEVKTRFKTTLDYFQNPEQSIIGYLQSVLGHLNAISSYAPAYLLLRDRVQSCIIELKDIAAEVEGEEEAVEIDDEKIVRLQERLNLIYNLQHKHQVKSIAELLDIQATLEQKVSKVLNLDEAIAKAQKSVTETQKRMQRSAEALSKTRREVFSTIESQVKKSLADLGIPNATLKINHETGKPTPTGIDTINLLFSANKGIQPQQLKNVASGGEFSRLMLTIKYLLANKRSLPTIVFDEIDTGVSGEIAIKVGNMMKEMARGHQIIAITHLHQIAAKGDAHYFVYKDNSSAKTVSRIKKLTTEERVLEIAQMIGGAKPTKAIIDNARELIGQNLLEKTHYKLDL